MAIDAEDLEPRKTKPVLVDLEKMSLEELRDYITDMEQKIGRAQAAIDAKQAHRNSIEGVFKT